LFIYLLVQTYGYISHIGLEYIMIGWRLEKKDMLVKLN